MRRYRGKPKAAHENADPARATAPLRKRQGRGGHRTATNRQVKVIAGAAVCPEPLAASLGSVSERSANLDPEAGFPDGAAVEPVVRVAEASDRDHPELRCNSTWIYQTCAGRSVPFPLSLPAYNRRGISSTPYGREGGNAVLLRQRTNATPYLTFPSPLGPFPD